MTIRFLIRYTDVLLMGDSNAFIVAILNGMIHFSVLTVAMIRHKTNRMNLR